MEDSIVPLPAESMLKETFGSKNKTVLDCKTTINTNIIGRAAINVCKKGFLVIVPDFSTRLCLQVRIPNTNIGKNTKKRGSIILKVIERNKNPRNTIEETNNRLFSSFEIMIING
jgi:hypothetical protein